MPKADNKPPFHRYNAFERQIYLSAFHISSRTVGEYVRALNKYQPAVLTGYAHSHFTLGRLMLDCGLALSYRPDALVLSSEKITPYMRQIIEQAFGARVFEEYGCVENCVLATECEEGRLHVSQDFGVVEILDHQGNHVPPGHDGRIVCTGLLNRNQILVRYEVGDTGRWAKEACPCGRAHLPVLDEIVGRIEDVVVGPDGREMVRFHGIFVGLPGVKEGQVIQLAPDKITVNVVTENGLSELARSTIVDRFLERLGQISVDVVERDSIERNSRGKFRAVISHLSEDQKKSISRF